MLSIYFRGAGSSLLELVLENQDLSDLVTLTLKIWRANGENIEEADWSQDQDWIQEFTRATEEKFFLDGKLACNLIYKIGLVTLFVSWDQWRP